MVRISSPLFQDVGGWVLTVLVCSLIVSGASAQMLSFPGTRPEVKSPDGRYVIQNHDDEKQEPAHFLVLIDKKSGSTKTLYAYGRHVDVLWSPTSLALIVNDYEGSDAAHPLLFKAPWKNRGIDLRGELLRFLRSRHEAKSALENHHVYVTAKQWLRGDEILCQITGYGDVDPNGFTHHYVYKIGNGFTLALDDPTVK
jgi:hypothetical protein